MSGSSALFSTSFVRDASILRHVADERGGRDHLDERVVAAVLDIEALGYELGYAKRRARFERRGHLLDVAVVLGTIVLFVALVGAFLAA